MEEAYLGLGGNVGDVEASIEGAIRALERPMVTEVLDCSSLYRNEPVGGPPGQPDYLNAVVRIQTALTPRQLLDTCLSLESRMGRVRAERMGPRTLDIDLLLYGRLAVEEEGLVIPHPRMRERLFVLAPLAEVAPSQTELPPEGKKLAEALEDLLAAQGELRQNWQDKIVVSACDLRGKLEL